ncbi:MAG TPA: DUF2304 domain-containing protein [Solirubrobacteraceae bacterium]|nr:DUF2304 domain-containing protein [Solirubrobacteraceae bacterium]
MDPHLRIVAIAASIALFLLVLELVRQRRLLERYALLWLASAVGLVALSASDRLLQGLADTIGVSYPPSALFAAAFFFIIVLLLHFSVAVSRLADQSKVLAQRLALSEERLAGLEARERLPAALDHNDETPAPIPQEVP